MIYFSVPPTLTVFEPKFRGEVYPLSMWSMFYRVHNQMEDYGVSILAQDGKPLSAPLRFEASGFPKSHDISAYHAIQKLGRAVDSGRKGSIDRARRTVEKAYLRGNVRYEVVARVWDPVERFKTGAIKREVVKGTFSTRMRGASP